MYSIAYSPQARRFLKKTARGLADSILRSCSALGANPRPPGCRKMEECPNWRIRVGPREDHRAVYSIDDKARDELLAVLMDTYAACGH